MDSGIVGLVPLLFGVVAVPLVCVAVTRAGATGRLERNGAVGIRTRDTQVSDAAWQAGHAAALPMVTRTVWVAVVAVVLAVATHVAAGVPWAVLVGMAGLTVESVLLVLAAGAAGRAARATAQPG
ncbi:SdpI family protein [Micromonospora sp. NPDC050187]|uniref:SdpI family protein n=1 Tax=Micromonospora sp. NPDC050187 TaxID=3364277 RepID=UPI003795FC05